MLTISLDAWVWHSETLTQTAQVRAAVGGLLLIAGLAQGWGRSHGLPILELPPQLAVLFAGVLSAVREQVPADERMLHVVVAALVVVSTLANLASDPFGRIVSSDALVRPSAARWRRARTSGVRADRFRSRRLSCSRSARPVRHGPTDVVPGRGEVHVSARAETCPPWTELTPRSG